MNKLEKIIFWSGLIIISIDNIYWQWWIKLTKEPIVGGDIFTGWSMVGDVIFLVVWIYILIRIYKKVNRKE
ncbi:hypothetical protein COY96_00220 [Candidatus Wolfebacteria bacterium CG_4_10_14_0_8_um_filter_37_11]|uniref:Uncharacterized protein n=1 Tax=Candidatus Wolfebacteria bacterium CG_4_10_14_0_8_um_filter_37_11 TaxID=1975062 RepID=A0A2M7Q9I2_9BACT|nr:MAG: hypothetical protein COY96_00220 [Candidatus Wolfebacteria bacterium CG_4_10_14_0_8_um_filter_37_11]